ncbi:MAG: hypothetical protein ACT4PZ_08180 [Panacagrimonas sp.]
MAFRVLKSLAASTLLVSSFAMAQSSTGNGSTGNSGNSGVSGGIGSDFAASNVAGANVERGGGLAAAIEAAFGADNKKQECDPAAGTC